MCDSSQELLLFHAVLGRGCESPFPATQGMAYTTALPNSPILTLSNATIDFNQLGDPLDDPFDIVATYGILVGS